MNCNKNNIIIFAIYIYVLYYIYIYIHAIDILHLYPPVYQVTGGVTTTLVERGTVLEWHPFASSIRARSEARGEALKEAAM